MVIVLLADGVRVDTLRTALDDGLLPAMSALRAGGGLHEVTSTFPSVTGPAYVPFLLGRFPGAVGVPGLRWHDRSHRDCGFPGYSRSYVGYQMSAVNKDLDPDAPTMFELAPGSAAALSMITRGLPRSGQLATLNLATAVRAARTHFGGDLDDWLAVDRETSTKVLARASTGRTPFLFAAFMGVDKLSHAHGQQDPVVIRALRIVDDTVGALSDVLRRRGALPETRIWVASDHGHSRVSRHDDLGELLETLGHRAMSHPWVYRRRPDAAVMVSGNAMAHVYVDLDRRVRPFWAGVSPRWRALANHLLERASVDLLIVPLNATRCEVWSRDRGRAVIRASAAGDRGDRGDRGGRRGRFSYCTTEGDPLGIGASLHQVTAREAHEATVTTDYPDSIVQIATLAAAPRSGDLILSAARGWDFREHHEPIPHVSSHGALHRDHMLVPLLLDGPVTRTPRRTADVMASALVALGIRAPELDGESFL
jgi:hypothetical protein